PQTSPEPQIPAGPSEIRAIVGTEDAWNAVYQHLGCTAAELSYTGFELGYEDGHPCYELEFCWNGNQYEYEIDCYTGEVLGHKWEACDEAHHSHTTTKSGHHEERGHH
ncbi:MAG: PepSY domain-containing protein, partial [Oscillospiraceae bacterium]|nr:PepSY domain-containing protein [Oscillospiraceae bacterium]